jgi:hypothetical protein
MHIIIFCQAPADIKYTLALYEEYGGADTQFDIYAVSVENMYRFLSSLSLKYAKIHFLPYPVISRRRLFSIISARRYVCRTIKKHFSHICGATIYYFANNYDWLTYAFIVFLSRRNHVLNYDHYIKPGVVRRFVRPSPRCVLRKILSAYLTHAHIKYELIRNKPVATLVPERYSIEPTTVKTPTSLFRKYTYRIPNEGRHRVLFFESDLSGLRLIANYQYKLTEIVGVFADSGLDVYIKPHPRLGHTPFLENMSVHILPAYIPGEFVTYDDFLAVVGISTITLPVIADIWQGPVFSLIDMFEFLQQDMREYYHKLLTPNSESRIRFIKDLTTLSNEIGALKKNGTLGMVSR